MDLTIIPRLYYKYKHRDDNEIREFLSKVAIVRKENKGIGTLHGYYPLTDEVMEKVKEAPRNVSLTFDATKTKDEPLLGLKVYKIITFLVKSTSRFFVKPDIGEVIDQIEMRDYISKDIKAICVLEEHENVPDTEGEHFLMQAELLIN